MGAMIGSASLVRRKHKNSKSARRFKRLREELSSRTAGRDL